MLVAVTGATGHVGATLTRALVARGDKVRAFFRNGEENLRGVDCERIVGDIRDPEMVDKAVRGAEVVYHLAAKISIDRVDPDVVPINVGGVETITEASLRHGVRRFIHFSSIHAFAIEPGQDVLDENRALNDEHDLSQPPYDRSKASGHRVVKRAVSRGLDAVVLHPAGIIGPNDFGPSKMGRILLSVARKQLPGVVNGGFSWVDVRDVVDAALAAETVGRNGENYLLSGNWHSIREVADVAAEVAGVRSPLLNTPMWIARAIAPLAVGAAKVMGGEPFVTGVALHALRIHRHTSHEKANRELGFSPRPIRQTLADTIAWYREAGMLKGS